MRVVDWDRVQIVAQALNKTQLTIKEIAKIGRITERTAYRWLDLIQESGADLVRRSRRGEPETYQILGDVEIAA